MVEDLSYEDAELLAALREIASGGLFDDIMFRRSPGFFV
jgi:hypothetical protein